MHSIAFSKPLLIKRLRKTYTQLLFAKLSGISVYFKEKMKNTSNLYSLPAEKGYDII